MPQEHKIALNGAYRSFVIDGTPKETFIVTLNKLNHTSRR